MDQVVTPLACGDSSDESLDTLIGLAQWGADYEEKSARYLIDKIQRLREAGAWPRRLDGEPKTWERFCKEKIGYDAEYLAAVEDGLARLDGKGSRASPPFERLQEVLALIMSLTPEEVVARHLEGFVGALLSHAQQLADAVYCARREAVLQELGMPPEKPVIKPEPDKAAIKAARIREWKSYREASVCARCGKEIARGEPVVLHQSSAWCEPCQQQDAERYAYVRDEKRAVSPCENCSRSVNKIVLWWQPRARTFCCALCRGRFRSRQRSAKKKAERAGRAKPVCSVCGQTFEAKRDDAKTCSPTCRQQARRQRQRASQIETSPHDDAKS